MSAYLILTHLFLISSCSADLYDKVRYFETLDSVNLQVATRKKRSPDGTLSYSRQISFKALGRKFNMVLFPGSNVIGADFKARTVDGDGRTQTFVVNPNDFYSGHLADDKSVEVDAHFEEGILSSNIYFPHETYVMEPAWRHLNTTNATMIVYRRSDVNWDEIFPIDPKTGKRTRMKDGIRLPPENNTAHNERTVYHNGTADGGGKSRHKRAVSVNICPLLTVADFQFFRDMGHMKRGITAAFLISTMQNINRYYRRTIWDSDGEYVNMGFRIAEMIIHTHFTKNPPDHYNADVDWHYNAKLNAFSRLRKISQFCLAHLFTSYPFHGNILGLAFIASESHGSAGGVCSLPTNLNGRPGFPRTGWSSAKNTKNEQVLSLQYELITTHELGHNWGSEHDPLTKECGPSSRNDGKYVMWAYSVPGYEANNKKFSPCSKRYIVAVLRSKSYLCFQERSQQVGLCGNGMIDLNEECDRGILEEGEEDMCCDKLCQLRKGVVCSDFNHDCCQNCAVANASVVCVQTNELACKDRSFCDGKSLECPQPGNLPDNTSCIDRGKCFNGICLNFCNILGSRQGKTMKPCLCTQNVTSMCRRCCAEVIGNVGGECLPTHELVDPGRTCYMGTCDESGHCVKMERQLSQRIFNFIKQLTVDQLVEFMRSNIVGTIVVLSMIIWIPASLAVSYVDRKNRKQHEMEFNAKKDAYKKYLHPSQMPAIFMAPQAQGSAGKQYAPQRSVVHQQPVPEKIQPIEHASEKDQNRGPVAKTPRKVAADSQKNKEKRWKTAADKEVVGAKHNIEEEEDEEESVDTNSNDSVLTAEDVEQEHGIREKEV